MAAIASDDMNVGMTCTATTQRHSHRVFGPNGHFSPPNVSQSVIGRELKRYRINNPRKKAISGLEEVKFCA